MRKIYLFAFIAVSLSLYGQERPEWIDNSPSNGRNVYFAGHGHGLTFETAKQNALNNAMQNYILDRISLQNNFLQVGFEEILVLNITFNEKFIDENSNIKTIKVFDEEIYLEDEFFAIMESGYYEYFVLLSIPRERINRLIPEILQHFTPFSGRDRLSGAGAINSIDSAIYSCAIRIIEILPVDRSIIIVAEGTSAMEKFASDELVTYISRQKKSFVFDRSSLHEIDIERSFQLSGEIDDDSIISIGHFTSADTVIAVKIIETAGNWQIRFKAIDTRTAQLLYQTFADFKL
jgi:hypothetical protein